MQINKCITSFLVTYDFSHFSYEAENNNKKTQNKLKANKQTK